MDVSNTILKEPPDESVIDGSDLVEIEAFEGIPETRLIIAEFWLPLLIDRPY